MNVEVEQRVVIRLTAAEALALHSILDDLSSDFAIELAAHLFDVDIVE